MNGLTLLVLLALAIGIVVAWRAGIMRGRREIVAGANTPLRPAVVSAPPAGEPAVATAAAPAPPPPESPTPPPENPASPSLTPPPVVAGAAAAELARLVRSLEAENAGLRRAAATAAAETGQLREMAEDRRRLLAAHAQALAETARYRDLVVDLENNAMPPLLDGGSSLDDLKLIVGIGPVLERMLHRLGVTTYRQIARWSERDIDEIDAKLPEFPGRIRRDGWVTQARELYQSKYGEPLPPRDRG